ncbi:MAG: hypothetical protein AAF368_20110, partial [Planctomycetota bacterium]
MVVFAWLAAAFFPVRSPVRERARVLTVVVFPPVRSRARCGFLLVRSPVRERARVLTVVVFPPFAR